jgi:hypothetical protein
MSARTLLVIVAAAIAGWFLTGGERQVGVPDATGGLAFPSYRIEPLEAFEIEARILSREDYRLGREADLSPTDLAIGWGPMANPDVLEHIEVSQGNRWYYWKARRLPIPRADIVSHSANVHVIPGSERVAAELARLSIGDQVRLSGSLVAVRAEDGWRWVSSLSRTDTGAGSCELLMLESLTRL